jgi:2,3-bisphosphoglycerate-independent phosphoglycerate mutase
MKGKIVDFASSFFLKKPGLKGVFVLIDGLGDLPHKLLDNKTPLEAADTPNLDFLATRGEIGFMYPVKPGFVPRTGEALTSIFGNDLILNTSGQLEALGFDMGVSRGDLAFGVGFASIDSLEEGNIIDKRVARTLNSEEAEMLSMALNKIKLSCRFDFKPTIQHRSILIFKGGFSDNISGNNFAYTQGRVQEMKKIQACKALDEDENSQHSCNVVNEFLKKAHEALDNHPVNKDRRKRGLLPANYLLLKGPGIEVPKLKKHSRWACVAYMPLEKGFAKASGMKVFSFDYPLFEELDAYENLWDGLKRACGFASKSIKNSIKNHDYIYVHINEIGFPSHDNKPVEKKMMLEYIDKTLFKFLRSFAPPNNIKVLVAGTNSTPCKLKNHSADPVPVLFYNHSIPKEKHFNEKEARIGGLGRIFGKELLKKIGFVK